MLVNKIRQVLAFESIEEKGKRKKRSQNNI